MKANYLMADWCMLNSDVTIIAGNINVVDLRDCGINILSQVTPQVIKKLSTLLEPFPVRIKAIHLVYPPKGIDTIFKLFMSLCPEKLRSRIMMHENFEELLKVIDKKHLPKEYGGTNSSLPEIIEEWKNRLHEFRDWLLEDSQYGVEISNGVNGADSNSMFGAEGSFRSLNID